MSSYRAFCNECGAESFISFVDDDAEAKFCPHCGSSFDGSSVDEQNDDSDDEEAWDKLSKEAFDDLDDADDWKINR
jgi:hypothetical protein